MKFRLTILGIALLLGLSSCTKELSSELSKSASSDSLAVPSDSVNVYVAGGNFGDDTLSGLQTIHAMYWKNGKPFTLDENTSFTTCIVLSGNDVYIGGAIAKPNEYSAASYWKNGTAILLTNGQTNARVTSLFINGPDVYASGWITAGNGNYIAAFWKNGQQTLLSDSAYYCMANGIAVNGSDVYVAG